MTSSASDLQAITLTAESLVRSVSLLRRHIRGLDAPLDAELSALADDVDALKLRLARHAGQLRVLLAEALGHLARAERAFALPAEGQYQGPLSACVHSSPACTKCSDPEGLDLARQFLDGEQIAEQIAAATAPRR
jgi:hypothetical protein